MKGLLLGSALLAALLGLLPAPAGAAAPTVEVDGGTLSVSARDSPLAEVLLAIGARVRARVLVESILTNQVGAQRVTSSFVRVPIEEGLRRVLRGRNFILGYGPAGVDEIRVYVDGKTGFQELTATRTPDVTPSKLSPSDAAKREANRERSLASPAADPARLARARHVVLTDADPEARLEALEELSRTKVATLLLGTMTDALAREKDPQVLDALLDLADDHGPRLAGALRAFAAGDRGGAAARARAVELLGEYDGADPTTRTLPTSATSDGACRRAARSRHRAAPFLRAFRHRGGRHGPEPPELSGSSLALRTARRLREEFAGDVRPRARRERFPGRRTGAPPSARLRPHAPRAYNAQTDDGARVQGAARHPGGVRTRMGWTMKWVSSFDNDFNRALRGRDPPGARVSHEVRDVGTLETHEAREPASRASFGSVSALRFPAIRRDLCPACATRRSGVSYLQAARPRSGGVSIPTPSR